MVEDQELLLSTGMENSYSFQRQFERHSNALEFLNQHDHISIRSTALSSTEFDNELLICSDIDGVTIEWKNISCTSHAFHHLFLAPKGRLSLKKVYRWLKKHEDLTKYNDVSLDVLRECVGAAILTDGGWEYVLCLLPEFDCKKPYIKKVIHLTTLTWITEVRIQLQLVFLEAVSGGEIKETIDKNNILDFMESIVDIGLSLCNELKVILTNSREPRQVKVYGRLTISRLP